MLPEFTFPHPTYLLEQLNLARNPLTKNDWVLLYRFLPKLKYLKEIRHNYSSANVDDILYELLHALPQCHELEKVEFMNLMFNTANQLKLIEMIENGTIWLKTLASEYFGKLLATIDHYLERIGHLITTIPKDYYQKYVKKIPCLFFINKIQYSYAFECYNWILLWSYVECLSHISPKVSFMDFL